MKSKRNLILLSLLAGIWIEFNEIPIFPLGFMLVVLWVRPINFKRYKFFIIAMILGFIGTGFSFKIFEEVTVNPKTGEEYHFSKYLFNLGLGMTNITQFLKRNTMTLYKDNLYQKEQRFLDNYLRGFVQAYNENNSSFSELKKNHGAIEDMYYLGYVKRIVNPINPVDLEFVYKIKFVENSLWRTIHFRITLSKRKVQILNIKIQDEEVEYETAI